MEQETVGDGGGAEFVERIELRMHPRHKEFPGPDRESLVWGAFVTGLSAAGPRGIPAMVITPDGQIIDGERRWLAGKQLGWERMLAVRRPEWEAAAIMVDSLMGQRHLTKGAKVYLAIPMLEEFVASAEKRRLEKLRNGIKTLEKPLKVPLSTQWTTGEGWNEIAERFGVSRSLLYQALQVRRIFGKTGHLQFEFQDGSRKTLQGHFQPRILDCEAPMGLGEVLKGLGWFVDEDGRVRNQAGPGERNSYLAYFESAWANFGKQWGRWEKMKGSERERAMALMREGVGEWPEEVREAVREKLKR